MAKRDKSEPSYYELLQHPSWQRVRLEVMQRAGFACEHCEADDKQLSVHHSYYEKGKKPWEYPTESLHCLCDDCHREAQDLKATLNRQLGRINTHTDLEKLFGFAVGIEAIEFPNTIIQVTSVYVAIGVAAAWELEATDVFANLRDGQIDGWKLSELQTAKFGSF
jgi:endonuclease IV